jgi:hypothetical protein
VIPTLINEFVRHLVFEKLQIGKRDLVGQASENDRKSCFLNTAKPTLLRRGSPKISIRPDRGEERLPHKVFGHLRTSHTHKRVPVKTISMFKFFLGDLLFIPVCLTILCRYTLRSKHPSEPPNHVEASLPIRNGYYSQTDLQPSRNHDARCIEFNIVRVTEKAASRLGVNQLRIEILNNLT